MNNNKKPQTDVTESTAPNSMELLDYLAVLVKWRKLILFNIVLVTIVAVITSLLLPNWYKATTTVLPPKQQDALGSLGAAGATLRGLTGMTRLGGFGQRSGVYNYLAILKSRSAMETVVRKFNLTAIYKLNDGSMEKAIKELENNVVFEERDDDCIAIDVYDQDPRRAADIANYFVEVLNDISIHLGTQEARSNREFIEKRLQSSKEQLRLAEEVQRQYQERSGMMITPEQAANVLTIAGLYGEKARKEVELAILQRTVSKDDQSLQQMRIELEELDKKVAKFPEAGLEAVRLYRDVTIQQKIVEFLVPLYEQARIDEQKDVPVILVLDKAVPPEKKARPQRLLLVVVWNIVGLFASVLFVFSREAITRLQDEGKMSKLNKEVKETALYRKFFMAKRE